MNRRRDAAPVELTIRRDESLSPKTLLDQLAAAGAAGRVADTPLHAPGPPPASLYIHVPFCFHKCHYCDFYSLVDTQDRQEAWVAQFERELDAHERTWSVRPLETIFVGGGTPTLLRPALWRRVLARLSQIPRADTCEFTVEANPETVDEVLLEALVHGGVNRMSIGCQSFDPAHLRTLERWHDPANVSRAVNLARRAGIANLNLDLIHSIPGQSVASWADDLRRAVDLSPEHLSCYGLTFEPGTALAARRERGEIAPIDDALQAEMDEFADGFLAAAGFERYEISNWAKTGRACRHNLAYWQNEDWWAIGPSASGHWRGWRWKNVPRLGDWLDAQGGLSPVVDVEEPDPRRAVAERFMLGLRMSAGIPLSEVQAQLTLGREGEERSRAIDRHARSGLLERCNGMLRLTKKGRLMANEVLVDLV